MLDRRGPRVHNVSKSQDRWLTKLSVLREHATVKIDQSADTLPRDRTRVGSRKECCHCRFVFCKVSLRGVVEVQKRPFVVGKRSEPNSRSLLLSSVQRQGKRLAVTAMSTAAPPLGLSEERHASKYSLDWHLEEVLLEVRKVSSLVSGTCEWGGDHVL